MQRVIKADRIKASGVIGCAAVIAVSALISMSTIMDRPSPFAASFLASLSGINCICSFIGSVAGYFISGNYQSFVIACSSLLSVMAVRLLMRKNDSRLISAVLAMTTSGSVFTANFISATSATDFFTSVALGILSGGGTLVMLHLKRLYKSRELVNVTVKNNPVGMITVLTSLIIGASILARYSAGIFNFGIIGIVAISAFCAMKYGAGAGAVAGAVGAIGIFLGSGLYPHLAGVLAVSGCIGAVMKDGRKSAVAGIYVLTSVLCTMLFTMDNTNLALVADVFMGCAVFMLIPRNALDSNREEALRETNIRENSIKELFVKRLSYAGGAIGEVRKTLDYTAKKLDETAARDISWVYNTSCDKVCRHCRYNMQCWGNEYGDSIKQFIALTKILQAGGEISSEDFRNPISDRCPKKSEICTSLTRLYKSYVTSLNEKRCIAQMRGVLTAQLSSTEKLLYDIAALTGNSGEIYSEHNKTALKVLESTGCQDISAVSVTSGENGRMYIEAYTEKGIFANAEEIANAMSLAFHKAFELPVIAKTENAVKLSVFSKTRYTVDVEMHQINKDENKVNGDYYDSFIRTDGTACVVLSDGMGSGSRARIDAVFATDMLIKLLKAGISPDSAIETVNSALMLKSSDESFATLDLLTIDLYSGKTELYKAGSADTFIRCGKVNSKIACKGLPLGVDSTPAYEKKTFTLSDNDLLILTSDGAELNEKWLFRQMNTSTDTPSEMAKNIAETARFYAGNGKSDDISVVVVGINK